jgi:cytochrome c oxidase subunit 2
MTPIPAAPPPQEPKISPPYDPLDMFPPNASSNAGFSVWVYYFIFWTCLVVLVAVCVATVWFAWKYRRSKVGLMPQDSPHHSTTLEIVWSVIPSFFLVAMFWYGFVDYEDRRNVPDDSYPIQARGVKWNWTFIYPNGFEWPELHVPPGEPVSLRIESLDVLHSVFIPAFRVKMDAVPGRYNWLWFNANPPEGGPVTYPLYCTEYCGQQHSQMDARVIVHESRAAFDAWLAKESSIENLTLEEKGLRVYRTAGCVACHSLDGATGTGPTFAGAWGRPRQLADGSTVTFDENYVRESILNPNAKLAAGFPPNVMLGNFAQTLNDEKISWLIALIQSKGGAQ